MPVSCPLLLLTAAGAATACPNCLVPGAFLLIDAVLTGAALFTLAVVVADDKGTLGLPEMPFTPPVLLAARRAAAS